jgi:prefoldin beta subunit
MAATNPGGAMAAEIDAEVAKFREIQAQLNKVRNDLQIVIAQYTENEMVNQELQLVDESQNVYKMVGPVLIKNSLEDARETVKKRLEFITSEKTRLEQQAKDLEKKGNEIAVKVQTMQSALQQATAAAVNEVAKAAAAEAKG